MSMDFTEIQLSLKKRWSKHFSRIFVVSFIFVISIASYAFGVLQGATLISEPIVVTRTESPVHCEQFQDNSSDATENCLFVGSKNGTKFYPPSCPAVKRISPENLRCFASENAALSDGFTRSSQCLYTK